VRDLSHGAPWRAVRSAAGQVVDGCDTLPSITLRNETEELPASPAQ
jgi:hypothetical protein